MGIPNFLNFNFVFLNMSSSFSVQCTSSGFSMTRKTCPRDIVYKKAIRSRTVLKMADNFKKIMGGEFELVLPVDDSLVTRVNLLRKTISQTYIHCEDDEEAIPLAKVQSALSFLLVACSAVLTRYTQRFLSGRIAAVFLTTLSVT